MDKDEQMKPEEVVVRGLRKATELHNTGNYDDLRRMFDETSSEAGATQAGMTGFITMESKRMIGPAWQKRSLRQLNQAEKSLTPGFSSTLICLPAPQSGEELKVFFTKGNEVVSNHSAALGLRCRSAVRLGHVMVTVC